MRKRKPDVTAKLGSDIRIVVPETALTVVFDECDRFDHDETGGRVIGAFTEQDGRLTVEVTGIIEPGPQARRSPVSFFQDGAHQERIFRQIEDQHPEIEHLGNWHTHHVNGLLTLSGGDIDTYRRTVNHQSHNTSFFYALLITARNKDSKPTNRDRYSTKHFVFRRGEEDFYEIPPRHVKIVDAPLVWPVTTQPTPHGHQQGALDLGVRQERVLDRDIIHEFYEGFRPFASQQLGVYWRGFLKLSDGSELKAVIVEHSAGDVTKYSVALREVPTALRALASELAQDQFASARAALIATERSCNRALFERRQIEEAELLT